MWYYDMIEDINNIVEETKYRKIIIKLIKKDSSLRSE
jgi:hypothetical protein